MTTTFKATLRLFNVPKPMEYELAVGEPVEIQLRDRARGFDLDIDMPAKDMASHQVSVQVLDPTGEVTHDTTETVTPRERGGFVHRTRVTNLSAPGVHIVKISLTEGGETSAPGAAPEGRMFIDRTKPLAQDDPRAGIAAALAASQDPKVIELVRAQSEQQAQRAAEHPGHPQANASDPGARVIADPAHDDAVAAQQALVSAPAPIIEPGAQPTAAEAHQEG